VLSELRRETQKAEKDIRFIISQWLYFSTQKHNTMPSDFVVVFASNLKS